MSQIITTIVIRDGVGSDTTGDLDLEHTGRDGNEKREVAFQVESHKVNKEEKKNMSNGDEPSALRPIYLMKTGTHRSHYWPRSRVTRAPFLGERTRWVFIFKCGQKWLISGCRNPLPSLYLPLRRRVEPTFVFPNGPFETFPSKKKKVDQVVQHMSFCVLCCGGGAVEAMVIPWGCVCSVTALRSRPGRSRADAPFTLYRDPACLSKKTINKDVLLPNVLPTCCRFLLLHSSYPSEVPETVKKK